MRSRTPAGRPRLFLSWSSTQGPGCTPALLMRTCDDSYRGRFAAMQTTLPKDIGTGTTSPGATRTLSAGELTWPCLLLLTTGGSRASEGSATFTKFRVLKRK